MTRRILPERIKARHFPSVDWRTLFRDPKSMMIALSIGVGVFCISSYGFTTTSANTVEPSSVQDQTLPKVYNDFRPQECITHGVSVDEMLSGGTTVTATSANGSLLLSDGFTTTMTGGSGDDCIVGNGSSNINAGAGSHDVCIGNTSLMTGCEHEYPL